MRRRQVHCVLALGAVGLGVAATCYLTWQELATRDVVVRNPATAPPAVDLTSDIYAEPTGRIVGSAAAAERREVSSAPGAGNFRVGTPSIRLSGRLVATVLSAAVTGAGLVIGRRILVRYRALRPDTSRAAEQSLEASAPPAASSASQVLPAEGPRDDGAESETEEAEEAEDVTAAATDPAPDPSYTGSDEGHETTVDQGSRPLDEGPGLGDILGAPRTGASPRSEVVVFERGTPDPVEFRTAARLQWEGHGLSCTAVDLSDYGATCEVVIDDAALPAPEETVQVTLLLNGRIVPLTATVMWSTTEGAPRKVRLRFPRLSADDRMMIDRALHAPR